MMDIQIDLYRDWINTAKEVFRGSGHPLPDSISDSEASLAYYLQSAPSEEEAYMQSEANKEKLLELKNIILTNLYQKACT
ncbi:hypothetical protein L1N85_15420 [Paenibacillus alkaliterrae]|uniref:hypothetical protein n=1 Tax=Paenibacillus alkaliterrae TaxID=320909 RepID=UPI001F49115D|nr:hypothetical protein [Paenibacillus alkaliterrae]MCF2939809.1 hypothetical protein [Paenibacillus alkaliterrae]